jgi:hypothetical protein
MRWPAWLTLGLILQLIGLARDRPLTGWMRAKVLVSAGGSALTGGLILWLAYHWLMDVSGLDWWDVIFFLGGATVGLIGWHERQQRDEL